MGEGLTNYYTTKISKENKIAFISTFLVGILIHIYKFVNTLPNHDSLYSYYSNQNVLGSGRWALSLSCGISSYYDLPWINGLLSCVYIALTAVVIVELFQIKNSFVIGLTGALLVSAPGVTETFFFLFTADGYMLAMLFAALAVWLSRIEEKKKYRWILSGVLICISCGIYQAYVSFALVLAVCYFIVILLENKHSKQECMKWIARQIFIYTVSLLSYYFIWKLCMKVSGIVANNYQGISEVGKFNVGLITGGIIRTIKSVLLYFLQWNVLENGFTLYSVLNIMFVPAFGIGLVIAIKKSGITKRKWALFLVILCLLAVMPFACIWHFTSSTVEYRAMMLQSLVLLFILCMWLYEKWGDSLYVKNIVATLLVTIIFNNALMANISYFYMNLCYERTYAEGMEMMMEIHDMQEQYDIEKVAFIGSRLEDVQIESINHETREMQPAGKIHLLSSLLEQSLLYDSEHIMNFMKATFDLNLESANSTERMELSRTEEVKLMKCWPSNKSMKVIDGTLVIKLSDKGDE